MKNKIWLSLILIFLSFSVYAEGEATLKNIKVNGTACQCVGYECSIELEASSATITYDLDDTNAKVDRLSGFKIDLLSELTNVKLVVTNELNGEKAENTYNINITKKEQQANFNLKSLTVNGTAMKVGENIYSFNYDCDYKTAKITLVVVPEDSNVKVIQEDEYLFDEGAKTLSANFYLQAENGERLEYGVIATREEKPSLKSLKLDYGEIEFDRNKYNYELTVPYNINIIKVEAEAYSKDDKVEIRSDDLVVGENEITVTVSNEKNKSDYIIKVTREENIDKSVANLSKLTIDEYPKLDFQENVLEYTLNFTNIPEKLNIHAISKDDDSTITILQNEDLKDGSKVIVKNELNESKIAREYILLVKKVEKIEENKTIILISIIALVLVIIVLLFLEIHAKKSEKKRYLKKIFDLRKKAEKLKKEGKILHHRKKSKKKNVKEEKEEELEII